MTIMPTVTDGPGITPVTNGHAWGAAESPSVEQSSTPGKPATRIQVTKREGISESELEDLLNEGWVKWHAEYKGNNLNVVLTRVAPVEPATPDVGTRADLVSEPQEPKPEQPTTVLVVESGKLHDLADKVLNPPAPALKPDLILEANEAPPPVIATVQSSPLTMFGEGQEEGSPAELYKAESNARIFEAGQSAYERVMAASRARRSQNNSPFTPSLPLIKESVHV